MTRRYRRDGGSADALGLALLAPAALGLAFAVVLIGRSVDGRATVHAAAEAAAQAAAQERTPAEAVAAAEQIGVAMLVDGHSCSSPTVRVDTSSFGPGGTVAVTVSCAVSTVGLELIEVPEPEPHTVTAVAAIDPLRTADAP